MVGAIVLLPTDAASQEAVGGSAQRVEVARARAPRDVAVQHFKLVGSARPVVQFEGILPESASCVAYALVDLDGQVGILVDTPPRGTQTRSSGGTPGPLPLR